MLVDCQMFGPGVSWVMDRRVNTARNPMAHATLNYNKELDGSSVRMPLGDFVGLRKRAK